jgi:N4-gp56 family major capsid protein
MAAPDNTTSSLSNEVAVWYDKVFLERARAMLVHQEGGQLRGIDGNVGKEAIFNRFSPIPVTTTPLSEGVNPTDNQLVSTQVTATLVEYGKSVYVSRLLSTTDIDDRDKEKIDVVGQNMGRLFAHVKSFLNNLENLSHGCILGINLCITMIRQPETSSPLILT